MFGSRRHFFQFYLLCAVFFIALVPYDLLAQSQANASTVISQESVLVMGRRRIHLNDDTYSISDSEIRALGALSIDDLVEILAPKLGLDRDDPTSNLVVFIDGRPALGIEEVQRIPIAAIAHIFVDTGNTAAALGFPPDYYVVIVETKRPFVEMGINVSVQQEINSDRNTAGLEAYNFRTTDDSSLRFHFSSTQNLGLLRANDGFAEATPRQANNNFGVSYARKIYRFTSVTGSVDTSSANSRSIVGADDSYFVPDFSNVQFQTEASALRTLNSQIGFSTALFNYWQFTAKAQRTKIENITKIETAGSISQLRQMTRTNNVFEAYIGGAVAPLPTGYATGSLRYRRTNSTSDSSNSTIVADAPFRQISQNENSRYSVSVPLTRRRSEIERAIGAFELTFSGATTNRNGFETRLSKTTMLNWNSPFGLRVKYTIEDAVVPPSLAQLDLATRITTDRAIFDPQSQSMRFTKVVTGGNPGLLSSMDNRTKIEIAYRPPRLRDLSFNIRYTEADKSQMITQFSRLTENFESAFPQRVTRDSFGILEKLDLRPINVDRLISRSARLGFAYSTNYGDYVEPEQNVVLQGIPNVPRPDKGQLGRWDLSLFYTISLENRAKLSDSQGFQQSGFALPSLNENSSDEIELDGGFMYRGFGFRGSFKWDKSNQSIDGLGDLGSSYSLEARTILNFGARHETIERWPLLENSALTIMYSQNNRPFTYVTSIGGGLASAKRNTTNLQLEFRKTF